MCYHGNERALRGERLRGVFDETHGVVDELAPSRSAVTSNLSARRVYRARDSDLQQDSAFGCSLSSNSHEKE